MKIKKTVTEKVIAANRENAQKGTGPGNWNFVSQNARQHSLLSKQLIFQTEGEKQEFNTLLDDLHDEWQAYGSDQTGIGRGRSRRPLCDSGGIAKS